MEYLQGADFSVYVFCDNGRSLSIVPMERKRVVNGYTMSGIIKNDQAIINYVSGIVNKLSLSGLVNVQLIKTKSGPKIYEINTRVSGAMIAPIAVGLNFPLLAVLQAFGHKKEIDAILKNKSIPNNISMVRVYKELYRKKNHYYK